MLALSSQEDLSLLGDYLQGMTNSEFRTASRLLSDRVLIKLYGENFWRVFSYLSIFKPKAFLGTCLKAAETLYKGNNISFEGIALSEYASYLREQSMKIDINKFLRTAVVLVKEEKEFALIWKMFGVYEAEERIDFLMLGTTPALYYEVFKECKRLQDSHDYLRKLCYVLIRKGDNLSFNLASIICTYFGIKGVSAMFSLNIEPYKLNYIESSRHNFEKIITSL